jgi:hypothetical protein
LTTLIATVATVRAHWSKFSFESTSDYGTGHDLLAPFATTLSQR